MMIRLLVVVAPFVFGVLLVALPCCVEAVGDGDGDSSILDDEVLDAAPAVAWECDFRWHCGDQTVIVTLDPDFRYACGVSREDAEQAHAEAACAEIAEIDSITCDVDPTCSAECGACFQGDACPDCGGD